MRLYHEEHSLCEDDCWGVVSLENNKCMHRCTVFDGTRKHTIAWFEGWEGKEEMKLKATSKAKQSFFHSVC
eukprot:scaffold57416_cov80-Attheya_sp.AAC.2